MAWLPWQPLLSRRQHLWSPGPSRCCNYLPHFSQFQPKKQNFCIRSCFAWVDLSWRCEILRLLRRQNNQSLDWSWQIPGRNWSCSVMIPSCLNTNFSQTLINCTFDGSSCSKCSFCVWTGQLRRQIRNLGNIFKECFSVALFQIFAAVFFDWRNLVYKYYTCNILFWNGERWL